MNATTQRITTNQIAIEQDNHSMTVTCLRDHPQTEQPYFVLEQRVAGVDGISVMGHFPNADELLDHLAGILHNEGFRVACEAVLSMAAGEPPRDVRQYVEEFVLGA